jgi:hypothetical protein
MRWLVLVAMAILIALALSRDQVADKVIPQQHESDGRLQITNSEIGRERYADALTKRFSATWRTVTFHASGPKNTTLHMQDVLANRSFIDDLVRDGKFIDEARAMGFRRLSFTDGFGNTWSQNIRPKK